MDFKQIQELIKTVNRSNIGELSIEQNDFKITIKQKKEQQVFTTIPAPAAVALPAAQPATLPAAPPISTPSAASSPVSETAKTDNFITIKSPMIGTFYRKPSPDKPLYVEVGDSVSLGSVVCVIEAMKLFNEIESEVSGKIVKVLVEDSSPVEFDQPLFLVDPS